MTAWMVRRGLHERQEVHSQARHVVQLSRLGDPRSPARPWQYCFAHENGEPFPTWACWAGTPYRFKDWCSEQTGYPNEMSEMALAHTVTEEAIITGPAGSR